MKIPLNTISDNIVYELEKLKNTFMGKDGLLTR